MKKDIKNNSNNRKQVVSLILEIISLSVLLLILTNVIVKKSTGETIGQTIVQSIYKKENIEKSEKNRGVYCEGQGLDDFIASKPIIYLYPTKTTEVEVKLGNPEKLSCTYPKYEDGWKVIANPKGDLTDVETGRSLYSLYWEGKIII